MNKLLFEKININNCLLQNRLTMAPMFTAYSGLEANLSKKIFEPIMNSINIIKAESQSGKGTKFMISLPCA